jgi:tRNA nucleotidyltransferase (CCA-adding enzyme)
MAQTLAQEVSRVGGTVYFVGGCVRDRLLGRETKDLDLEVHGIPPETLAEILDRLGRRMEIGASFGIYGLKGYGLDIALPRRERATGAGHRDFAIQVDPFAGVEAAARRRDFTVNALLQNVLTGEILDPFGGRADLAQGILRHVDENSFPEDPLRVLRGAQFAARFGFRLAPETAALCRSIPLDTLSRERVLGELEKALLQAPHPAQFFAILRDLDQLDVWFPEGKDLIGVPQEPRYHQEGDVWDHTMLVVDQAARFRDQVSDPLGFLLAALTHDFGKVLCTRVENGAIHAYGHETEGLPRIETFLRRLTGETKRIQYVLNLAQLHMKPNMMAAASAKIKATNKLFDQAAEPLDLIYLAEADRLGQKNDLPPVSHVPFLLDRLAVYQEMMARPHVTGKDLIAQGLPPGRELGDALAYAHKLRLAGVDRENALKQTLSYARKAAKRQENSPQ